MRQWKDLLKELDHELGAETVDKWLRTLKVLKFDAGNLYLDAEDAFQIHWFKEYLSPLLPKRFVTGTSKEIKIHFSIQGKSHEEKAETAEETRDDPFAPTSLEPHATFEGFIPSDKNALVFQVFEDLTQGELPQGNYNPIYVYGPKGSGKSHLLMATARALKEKGRKCLYVRADTFTDHVIHAFRSTSLQEFRKVYRDIEVLILDDVHLLARKSATQEELFHTFNRLHTAGFQIVIGSRVAPSLLEDIEERLVSRFEWGITLSIAPPTEEHLKLILERRAEALVIPLSPSLTDFFLSSFRNPLSLVQALHALALRLPNITTIPDLEIVKHLLLDLSQKETESSLSPEKILKIVANTFGIKIEDILGKKRSKEQALPRQIAMYLCRKKLRTPFLKIGRLFSRDHSTVMTSVKRVEKALEKKEEEFLLPLSEINKIID